MTLLSPLKVRFTPLVVLFTVLALTMSSFIVRATEVRKRLLRLQQCLLLNKRLIISIKISLTYLER